MNHWLLIVNYIFGYNIYWYTNITDESYIFHQYAFKISYAKCRLYCSGVYMLTKLFWSWGRPMAVAIVTIGLCLRSCVLRLRCIFLSNIIRIFCIDIILFNNGVITNVCPCSLCRSRYITFFEHHGVSNHWNLAVYSIICPGWQKRTHQISHYLPL